MIVSEIVAVCIIVVDVAVIVIVAVSGVVPDPLPVDPPLLPLPHPHISPRAAKAATSVMNCSLRRFLPISTHRHIARADTGKNLLTLGVEFADWETEDLEIVSTDVAAVPDGVTVAGLKAHVVPVGSPEHAKLTAELKPYCGVTVRVAVPGLPDCTVSEDVETPNVKLAAGALEMARETGADFVIPPLAPATVRV